MTDTIRRSGEERQASIQHTAAALGIDEALVSQLGDTFYARVREDDLLGPIFQAALGEDWDPHLAKLKDFWSAIALARGAIMAAPCPRICACQTASAKPISCAGWACSAKPSTG